MGDQLCLLEIQIKGESHKNTYCTSKFAGSATHETLYRQPSAASVKAKDFDLRNDRLQRSKPAFLILKFPDFPHRLKV
jgi:hypothetical protein